MTRTKAKKEIHYKPDNRELILGLSSMPKWSAILLQNNDKPYKAFLEWLLANDFLKSQPNNTKVKTLSDSSGFNYPKVTKWLREIYDDILKLNCDSPDLFKEEGIKHEFYACNYDDNVNFTIWLPVTPRLHEACEFRFLKAKLGTDQFWVSHVSHVIGNDETVISIWLKGGFVNYYREMLVHRAMFEGQMGFSQALFDYDFKVDEELKKIYR